MTEKWVLIIDDAEAALKALKKCVEDLSPNFHAVTTQLADEARSHLNSRKFDLVVCDDKIGESNDLDLLDAIQTMQPEAAILLMIAYRYTQTGTLSNPFMPYPSLPKPVDLEAFKKTVKETLGTPTAEHKDFMILSDERYRQVNELLARLKSDIGARCIFLTDTEGQVITRIGMVDQIPLEQIASLIAGSMATLLEAGRGIDGDSDTVNLAYREGKNENLCVVNIGMEMLLIIVFGKGPYSSRLGTVWYFARRTAQTMLGWIHSFEDARPGQMFVSDVEKAVGSELDFIRQDLHTSALPERLFEEDLHEQENLPDQEDILKQAAAKSGNPFLYEDNSNDLVFPWEKEGSQGLEPDDFYTNDQKNPLE
jgi:ActR/RegA family two-component response regulator